MARFGFMDLDRLLSDYETQITGYREALEQISEIYPGPLSPAGAIARSALNGEEPPHDHRR